MSRRYYLAYFEYEYKNKLALSNECVTPKFITSVLYFIT